MKAKIIIVEDHELSILLSKYGYEIIAIEHFDTVVEDCLRENADLILLDINCLYMMAIMYVEPSEKNQKYRL